MNHDTLEMMTDQNQQAVSHSSSATANENHPEQLAYGKWNWKKWGVVYVVIGALISAGIYYFVFSKQSQKPYSTTYPQPTTTVQPTTAQQEQTIDTSNWKTYMGTRLSFKYPSNLYVVTGEANGDPHAIGIVDNSNTDYRAAGFIIDASLKNNPYYSDYDKTLSVLEQGLIGMQTKTTRNGGVEIFGQLDPNSQGQGAGVHVRSTIFHYGNGAIVVTSPQEYAKYIDDSTYDKIVSSIQVKQ